MVKAKLSWPPLPLSEWLDTYQTLHLWTQIAGKVRMELSPPQNHWWHVALYVNARGLTTSAIPYGSGAFEIQFDFINHQLEIRTSDGAVKTLPLGPRSVASFYSRMMEALRSLGIDVSINTKPQEIPDAIPFDQDESHVSYDADSAHRFFQVLLSASMVFQEFRSGFIGKCSPVHFFWGSFDLACTRFCGRTAPPRKGVITGPAYSHEVSSVGFWPGAGLGDPAFYSYMAPSPPGLDRQPVRPGSWNPQLSEFILMYDDVRRAASPRQELLDFCESTYDAGAKLANWDRAALELPRSAAEPMRQARNYGTSV